MKLTMTTVDCVCARESVQLGWKRVTPSVVRLRYKLRICSLQSAVRRSAGYYGGYGRYGRRGWKWELELGNRMGYLLASGGRYWPMSSLKVGRWKAELPRLVRYKL